MPVVELSLQPEPRRSTRVAFAKVRGNSARITVTRRTAEEQPSYAISAGGKPVPYTAPITLAVPGTLYLFVAGEPRGSLLVAQDQPSVPEITRPIVLRYAAKAPGVEHPAGQYRLPECEALLYDKLCEEVSPGVWEPDEDLAAANAAAVDPSLFPYLILELEPNMGWDVGAGRTNLQATTYATKLGVVLDAVRGNYAGKLGVYGWLPKEHGSWGYPQDVADNVDYVPPSTPGKMDKWKARNELVAAIIGSKIDYLSPIMYMGVTSLATQTLSQRLTLRESTRLRAMFNPDWEILPTIWHRHTEVLDLMSAEEFSTLLHNLRRYNADGAISFSAPTATPEQEAGPWEDLLQAYWRGQTF